MYTTCILRVHVHVYNYIVVWEIFVVKFSYVQLCMKISIAVYKYTRNYGKGSSVRKFYETLMYEIFLHTKYLRITVQVHVHFVHVHFVHVYT